jgi:SpoVK/Ycf46/Vps4 family AAA+-type ATPase
VAVSPEVLRALEQAVVADPENRPLRLHYIDLLLEDGQNAAALGHCESLIRAGGDDEDVRQRQRMALERLGVGGQIPQHASVQDERPASTATGEKHFPVSELLDIVRPDVTLADVAGMRDVKQRLELGFLGPLRNEELRRAFGHTLRTSLLLWGPPGCGKTFIAKALAGELGLYFIHLGLADVLDMWIGNSEKNIRDIFAEARRMKPTVLFIDELDALGHKRAQVSSATLRTTINQLLIELDGATSDNEGVLILGATNQIWDIDPALLRPGRFDRQVIVLPPDEPARRAVLQHHLQKTPCAGLDLDGLARRSEGLTGADLARVASRATEFAMHESVRAQRTLPVTQAHLELALADTPRSADAWFRVAENYVAFADDGDRYAELAQYLAARKRFRR